MSQIHGFEVLATDLGEDSYPGLEALKLAVAIHENGDTQKFLVLRWRNSLVTPRAETLF